MLHIQRIIARASLAAIVAGTALAAAGCGRSTATTAPPAPEVVVASAQAKPVRQWDEFNGRVAATDSVEVRARVSGYIDRIAFKEGDEVKAGDLLFVIDPRPYRAAYDSAVAQLERARAAAQLAQAQDQRAQALIAAKAISREEFETRRAGLTQGNADVRAAEAAVATAKLNLGFTEVRAPIGGRASRALLTVGNLAQADQTALTSVVSQDPMYVYFDADEHSYLRYKQLERRGERKDGASPVRVGLADEDGFPREGKLDFLDNQVDARTGTIRVRALLANADRTLTPGLYARVRLGGGEAAAVLIDDKAVLTDQDRKYVYVLGAENKALRRDIVLGRASDGLRVVQSGLDAGDKVVVAGMQKIFYPGMVVRASEAGAVAPPVAANAAR